MYNLKAKRIAAVNDAFRCHGTRVSITNGVQALGDVMGLIAKVRSFDDFTEDNDPYGEHDFGCVTWHGAKVFWKISYFDKNFVFGKDPLAFGCKRVLTIMLASEY